MVASDRGLPSGSVLLNVREGSTVPVCNPMTVVGQHLSFDRLARESNGFRPQRPFRTSARPRLRSFHLPRLSRCCSAGRGDQQRRRQPTACRCLLMFLLFGPVTFVMSLDRTAIVVAAPTIQHELASRWCRCP